MKNKKYLVVLIHDATPAFKSELNEIVSELDRIGIKKRSVLVIPNYYEKNNILGDVGFIEWLNGFKDNKDELVLHGYEHLSTNHNYSSRFQKILGTKVNHGEAEFQNISYKEAREKIQKGKQLLEKVGISSKGFVAPAWLLNPESEKAIKDSGFDYCTTFRHIHFIPQQKKEKAEAIVFTSGKGLVNKMFALYNHDLVHRVFKKRRIARIAVHPKDLHSGRFKHILDLIKKVRKGRELATYADIVDIENDN